MRAIGKLCQLSKSNVDPRVNLFIALSFICYRVPEIRDPGAGAGLGFLSEFTFDGVS